MRFSTEELNVFRQWHNAVEDLNPEYLKPRDKRLYEKVLRLMRASQQNNPADECGDAHCRKMAKYEGKYDGYCDQDSPCFIHR